MFIFLFINTKSTKAALIVAILFWLYQTIYFVVWSTSLSVVKKSNTVLIILFTSSLWAVLEYIKNYFLSGFPINLLGYSQSCFTQIIQIADICGVYGISFIIVLINVFLFYWLYMRDRKYLITVFIIISLLLIYGFVRINQISKINNKEEIKIGVVQPNIEQKYKFKRRYIKPILYKLKQIETKFENKNLDIILYPETVLPKHITNNKNVNDFINKISYLAEYTLIGGMDVENYKVYNSMFLVSKNGDVVDKYRKKHLIIFGEYIPFEGLISKMFSKFITDNNLIKEIELKVFEFDKYTLGINICSENYYPYLSRELVLKGATLLTTHSNDAWCDGLSYPYQHFVLNIFRAIENRKYLIISANTGISGVIAPTGKAIRQTKNQEQICFEETVYTNDYITIYDKICDLFVYLCIAYIGIFLLCSFLFGKIKNR